MFYKIINTISISCKIYFADIKELYKQELHNILLRIMETDIIYI
jgi:hypothetical protein